MIKKIQLVIGLCCLCLLMTVSADAQKVGYTSTLDILKEMPAVQQANSRLDAFKKQLSKQGENMVIKLQNKFKDAQDRYSKGELTAQEVAAIEADLQKEQLEIQKFSAKAEEDLAKKQAELFQPILEEVQKAIDAVADEGGYNYIFNLSVQGVVYVDETLNVTEQVKAKL